MNFEDFSKELANMIADELSTKKSFWETIELCLQGKKGATETYSDIRLLAEAVAETYRKLPQESVEEQVADEHETLGVAG